MKLPTTKHLVIDAIIWNTFHSISLGRRCVDRRYDSAECYLFTVPSFVSTRSSVETLSSCGHICLANSGCPSVIDAIAASEGRLEKAWKRVNLRSERS